MITGQLINANDRGAIGSRLTTTGDMTSGSSSLTVANASGWKLGTGIAVAGAGASGATLQATVTAIFGSVLTLDTSASTTVSGADVNSDEYAPIQGALDYLRLNGGGVVQLDVGTYIIGTPDAPGNAPLFIGSNTTLRGAGTNLTFLKPCDNAKQLPIAWATKYPLAATPSDYPNAGVLVNYGNTHWHANQPFPSFGDPFSTPIDVNIGVEDLTVDGNSIGNIYISSGGNQTDGAIDNPIYAFKAAGTSGGSLTSGHDYNVAVTYCGPDNTLETCSNPGWLGLTLSGTAIEISLSNAPDGATRMFVYIQDVTSDPTDTTTYPAYPLAFCPQAWEKVGPISIPGGGTYTITSHAAGSSYPPGIGTFTVQGQDSSISHLIYFDNLNGFKIKNVDIKNGPRDGLCLAILDTDSRQTGIPHPVVNGFVENVRISQCMRGGMTVTGATENILVKNLFCDGNTGGFLLEADSSPLPSVNLKLIGCTFRKSYISPRINNGGVVGASITGREDSPARGIQFVGCMFDWNLAHFTATGNDVDLSVVGCSLVNSLTTAMGMNNLGGGTISGCSFITNGMDPSDVPTYMGTFADEGGDIQIGTPAAVGMHGWVIQGNHVEGATPVFFPHEFLLLTPGTHALVKDNVFGFIETPFSTTRDTESNACRILVEGMEEDHQIGPNFGHYHVMYFHQGTARYDIRQSAANGGTPRGKMTPRQDLVAVDVDVPSGSTYVDVSIVPDVVSSSIVFGAVPPEVGYSVSANSSWDWQGYWITNKTQSGFRINWHTAPGADKTLDFTLEYVPPHLVDYAVSPTGPLSKHVSDTQQFTVTATYSDGTVSDVTSLNALYVSSDPAKGTVDPNGLLTCLATGSFTITISPPVYMTVTPNGGSATPALPLTVSVTVT